MQGVAGLRHTLSNEVGQEKMLGTVDGCILQFHAGIIGQVKLTFANMAFQCFSTLLAHRIKDMEAPSSGFLHRQQKENST